MKAVRTVGEIGEFGLIARIAKLLPQLPAVVGVGDDAAALPLSFLRGEPRQASNNDGWLLMTVDSMVEDRHFRQSYCDAESVGWKLLACSLSDIAAMGGEPRAAVINLALPSDCAIDWVMNCYHGILKLASEVDVQIVGGDTVSASERSLCLTLLGYTSTAPVMRSGAREGDAVWVSGCIGDAYAGFRTLEMRSRNTPLKSVIQPVELAQYQERFLRPMPRMRLGRILAEHGLATSMIDISDGLLQDLTHIARSSEVDIELGLDLVPLSTAVDRGLLTVADAITGGEDYELLWTSPPSRTLELKELLNSISAGATCLGKVTGAHGSQPTVVICHADERIPASRWLADHGNLPSGFDHFHSQK